MTAPVHIPNACEDCAAPLEPWLRWPGMFTCSAGCKGVYPDWDQAKRDEVERMVEATLQEPPLTAAEIGQMLGIKTGGAA